jgi:hypothetical protein
MIASSLCIPYTYAEGRAGVPIGFKYRNANVVFKFGSPVMRLKSVLNWLGVMISFLSHIFLIKDLENMSALAASLSFMKHAMGLPWPLHDNSIHRSFGSRSIFLDG